MTLVSLRVKPRNTKRNRRHMGALLGAMVQVTYLFPNNNKNWCLCRTLVEDEVVGFGSVEALLEKRWTRTYGRRTRPLVQRSRTACGRTFERETSSR